MHQAFPEEEVAPVRQSKPQDMKLMMKHGVKVLSRSSVVVMLQYGSFTLQTFLLQLTEVWHAALRPVCALWDAACNLVRGIATWLFVCTPKDNASLYNICISRRLETAEYHDLLC